MSPKLISLSFSDGERRVLKILGRKRMTVSRIAERFYGDVPMNGSIVIASIIRKITLKCERSKSPWTLRGEGVGRAGRTVWRTKL